VRRMLLFQANKTFKSFKNKISYLKSYLKMMSAHDEKLRETHRSPCQGMVLSGRNPHAEASIKKRHEAS